MAAPAEALPPRTVDGPLLKQALLGSLSWLAANQEEVNRLNVFPVPDGDTGTNMLLTLQSAVEDVRDSPAKEVGKVAHIAAHGSLMGARGNSGVILSQIFRGFAKHVQGQADLNPKELAKALEEAADAAYRAVLKPTEGTILTVAREAARAAVQAADEQGASARSVIAAAAAGAKTAVEKTPGQLAILREAGVVDAGGYGLQIMLEGMLRTFDESAPPAEVRIASSPAAQKALALPEEGWGYCTEFILEGEGLDVEKIREEIAAMGNSVLVVGEPEVVKVHVHTDEPTRVITYAGGLGTVAKLNVSDMSKQHQLILDESSHDAAPAARQAAPASKPAAERRNGVGLVAVTAGQGLMEIFRDLGVDAIVEGGQTMNPSTQDMLHAVDTLPYGEVILLPNNRNVILAAREVDKLTPKRVHVLETGSIPEGIEAVVAFSPERELDDNLKSMHDAADRVQTIEVTHAVRDTKSNGLRVKKGDVIALINDKLKHAGGDYGEVVRKALQDLGPDSYELVTVFTGQEASSEDREKLVQAIRETFPSLEVEVQAGGQQHYPFILAVG
ncbi:MAG TPA: DAK2 domain-containing protein [Candidatus Dormibacteraeota bacterium]